MNKRTILYGRVSKDDRDNDSRNLKGQLDTCREYAQVRGYLVVAELAEDERGASSASFDLPQLNRALEMARDGESDILVVRELDRFARGLAKQLIVEQEFKWAGVDVEYVLGEYPDTPEGNLNKNIKAVIAEYERLKITERMHRGKRLKVKAGNVSVGGRPPYGYAVKEQDGKRVLEIYEPEAQIVRLIYTWYTEGDGVNGPMSLSAIARKLSEMKVPTSVDSGRRQQAARKMKGYGEWIRPTVAYMIKNETYTGVWHYGKRNEEKKTEPRRLLGCGRGPSDCESGSVGGGAKTTGTKQG